MLNQFSNHTKSLCEIAQVRVETDVTVAWKKLKNATMGNRWKGEISRTIQNLFRFYNGIDILKLLFLEELYQKTFVVPYVLEISYYIITDDV